MLHSDKVAETNNYKYTDDDVSNDGSITVAIEQFIQHCYMAKDSTRVPTISCL